MRALSGTAGTLIGHRCQRKWVKLRADFAESYGDWGRQRVEAREYCGWRNDSEHNAYSKERVTDRGNDGRTPAVDGEKRGWPRSEPTACRVAGELVWLLCTRRPRWVIECWLCSAFVVGDDDKTLQDAFGKRPAELRRWERRCEMTARSVPSPTDGMTSSRLPSPADSAPLPPTISSYFPGTLPPSLLPCCIYTK